jgi:hypothetical protein
MPASKCLLLSVCIACSQLLTAQDGKLSWYYPKLDEAYPRNGKNGSYTLNMHGVNGCVSGNCKSGTGEYLRAQPSPDAVFPSMTANPVMRLTLYKGTFSNDGKNFEGTVYVRDVSYDVTYKKDEPRLVPKEKHDLRDEQFWKSFEVASGSMQSAGSLGYRWHGWMQTVPKPGATTTPGQPLATKTHFMDGKAYVKNQYAPGGVYTGVEGRALEDGNLVGGRISFPDGSMYEGMLHTGRRFGPGRYKNSEGKIQEGIWMLDSLAIPTAVTLPPALFEPGKEGAAIAKIPIGGYPALDFADAGNGWVYAFYSNVLFIGKMENGKLNGPGYWKDRSTFFTGLFKDGRLETGMKVFEKIIASKKYTTVITGEFSNGQLKPSCAKMTRYDQQGIPIRMIEGYFYPSQDKENEFADGWAYVNDWSGKRDAANLQYLYNNENYLSMSGDPTYVSWFTKGLKESATAAYCFPSMKSQAAPLLALMKDRHDSVVVYANKREADIAAYKAAWNKRETTRAANCAAEQAKYNYTAGELFQMSEGSYPTTILLTGSLDCAISKYLVYTRRWVQSTEKKGYWNLSTNYLSGEEIKKAKKIPGSHTACSKCGGRGSIPVTEYHDVGGSSGYTYVGGGWMVKNPETYWKLDTWHSCKECAGAGFTRTR